MEKRGLTVALRNEGRTWEDVQNKWHIWEDAQNKYMLSYQSGIHRLQYQVCTGPNREWQQQQPAQNNLMIGNTNK